MDDVIWKVNNVLIPHLWNGNTEDTIRKIKEQQLDIKLSEFAELVIDKRSKKPYFKKL